MKKEFLLVRSNIHKGKGQAAALTVLMLLAAVMLNLWLMLLWDYRQNFDRYHDKLNAEHVTLAADGDNVEMQSFLTRLLQEDKRTAEFSLDKVMHMVGLFDYNGGRVNSELIIFDKQTAVSRQVGRIEIVEEGEIESGIYMPLLYKSEDMAVGKAISVFIGNNEFTYTVCGFFNSIMAGSHNCGMCALILTEDKYQELEAAGCAPESVLCSIRLKDKTEDQAYEAMIKNAIASEYPFARTVSNTYTLVTQSRYISQMICSGIISAMAFFILLIALIVTASNILNYIQVNMKNLGALKAVGYTSRQLINSLLLQFLGISLTAAVAGAGISYILFYFVNNMMISQTGIPYNIHFLSIPFIATLFISGAATALIVRFSCGRIRKIEPITALRQGLLTYNFKRNYVPLEKTRLPLPFALALKTTLSGIKHNITICITMFVLSLIIVFSGVMVKNVIWDMTPFINLIAGETADACINISAEIEEDFLQAMNENKYVEKVYLYNSITVRHVEGVELLATLSDDFYKINNQSIVFEGRFPKYDNEIAIAAKYAKEEGLKLGNEIVITANGNKVSYIISGFTQTSNMLGKDCLMTRAGYKRLGEMQNISYYLNLTKDADIEDFNARIKEQFGNSINATINIKETIDAVALVYVSLMTVIVAAILILSAVIIAFVLYLLVRTMLNNKKQDYGIMKALGFTTGQLILQTALSFMPAVILSAVVGITACCFIINPLTALFLSGIGIVKCRFIVPVSLIFLEGIGIVLFAFAMVCLLSLKVRKIAPKTLLVE